MQGAMADMVLSAVSQETVSRGVSHMLSNVEERASKEDSIQRLETAHCVLQFALERSGKLPITDVSLLRQRRMIKRSYEECCAVLDKHKDQALVTNPSSNFSKRIIRTVSYYLLSPGDDELSRSAVRRFERHADEADRFVRNVESGCSLAHYRFFNPLITQLLQGESLWYTMVQGRRDHGICMYPVSSEDHGVAAWLFFWSNDPKMPTKCFDILLMLRLSESMDIFGVAINCLQPLGRPLRSLARAAIGEISQVPAQDFARRRADYTDSRAADTMKFLTLARPDPLCCRANGHRTCADDNVIPSELSYRFPEEVISCSISAPEHNLQSSSPLLMVSAHFYPHYVGLAGPGEMFVSEVIGVQEQLELLNGTSLSSRQQMEEMLLTNAVNGFIREPQLTVGCIGSRVMVVGWFAGTKPEEKVRRKPTTGPTTRRAAKRSRLE